MKWEVTDSRGYSHILIKTDSATWFGTENLPLATTLVNDLLWAIDKTPEMGEKDGYVWIAI